MRTPCLIQAISVVATLGFVSCTPAAAGDAVAPGEVPAPRIFKPGLVYNGAAFANLGGGVRPGGTYTSNLNLQISVDGAALFGWSDTIGYLDALWLQGGLPSNFIGDAQGVSSISAPNAVKLYEAWVQKNFVGNHLSVLVGLYDLNSEFYTLQSARLFLNSSFGIGPEFALSGVEGPSIFPDTSVGMRIAFKPAEGVVIRTAVLDGVPVDRPNGSHGIFEAGDGALIVGEVAFVDRPQLDARGSSRRLRIGRQSNLGEYDQKVAIGGWYYRYIRRSFGNATQRTAGAASRERRGLCDCRQVALHRSGQSGAQTDGIRAGGPRRLPRRPLRRLPRSRIDRSRCIRESRR
jgi:porin